MATNVSKQQYVSNGTEITSRASADVVGKTFVKISGNATDRVPAVNGATAAGRIFGVVAHDAKTGTAVTTHRKGVVNVTAGGNISAFQEVEVGANSKAVVKASGVAVGYALFDATSGNDVVVSLY